jgi:hypothetical protein
MLAALDLVGVALVITALGTSTAGIITAFVAFRSIPRVETKVDRVHHEVQTANGKTLAKLADLAEGRRSEAIAPEDRTASEQEHVDLLRADERGGAT